MATFDERYDPIYQRGHAGGPPPVAPERARPVAPEPYSAGQGGAAEAGQGAGQSFTESAAQRGAQRAVPHDGPGIVEVVPDGAAAAPEGPAAPGRRRSNPYLIVLWLVGGAATVFGVWAALLPAGTVNVEDFGPAPSVWLFVVPQLSPGFLAGGIVCIGLALAVHALAWQRRP